MKDAGLFDEIPPEVWHIDWNVNSQAVGSSEASLKYLAPYVFKVAISNSRILKVEDRTVFIRYRKPHSHRLRTLALEVMDFIRRFLQSRCGGTAHRVHESPLLWIHEPQLPCSPRSRQYPDRNVLRLQSALTQNRHRTLAALSLSNLWRYPQTPFLTAASQNSCVFGIGGIQYQKTKICSSCFPPALSRAGGLAEVRPLPKVSTPRPQLKSRRPIKSPRLIIIGALNPILRHPVSACHASQLPAIINQQKQYPYMDRHCGSGLIEQRIETTFQVVSIIIG